MEIEIKWINGRPFVETENGLREASLYELEQMGAID